VAHFASPGVPLGAPAHKTKATSFKASTTQVLYRISLLEEREEGSQMYCGVKAKH